MEPIQPIVFYNEEFTNKMSGVYSRIFTTKQTRRDITSQYNF